ncbi:DUF3883 domain-containing protein [Nannocystis sp. SCPEA4]|uniref:protein NO VEIN domain-containing protein n=1 Tax=Nannocystis sp. SCPEA4 TaxID=2996787 RepID=UPI00226ED1B7|nr:DUF3883 domain-containing protein [Nannocystis sp. SCPEA4]
MRLIAITAYDDVRERVAQFRRSLRSSEIWPERKVGNPGHTSTCDVYVHRDLGFWAVLEEADSQSWHVFGRIDSRFDNEATTLGHICQVNFSFTDDPGRVAGLFAADGRGRVYVTHSGRVGGGKPGVGKNAFLDYVAAHASHLRIAEIEVDGALPTSRLVLGELNTPRLRAQMAEFVRLVEAFKAHVNGDELTETSLTAQTSRRGQGYERDPEVRRVVEEHAMNVVANHYRAEKYSVAVVSNQPGEMDLKCIRRGKEIRVEVKGTSGDGDSVEVTAAEVQYARRGATPVHLAVLSGIQVDRTEQPPRASGGTLYIYKDFDPDHHGLTPTRYRCKLDHSRGEPA